MKKSNGNMLVWIIVFIAFLCVGWFSYKFISGGDPAPIVKTKVKASPTIEPEQAKLAQGIYERNYNTTFFFAKNQIAINDVKVTGLKRKTAIVVYNMNINSIPRAPGDGWVNKNNFILIRKNSNKPATRIDSRVIGTTYKSKVIFKVPSKFLNGPAYLNIDFFTRSRGFSSQSVRLLLSIPKEEATT